MSDEQQIKHLMEEWERRTAAGDLEGLLALTADHAVFLSPGAAPITKADFAADFRKISAKARIERTGHVLAIFRRSAAGWQLARAAKLIARAVKPERV